MITTTLYIGSSSGPPAVVVSTDDGKLALLTDVELVGDEVLYNADGAAVATLNGEVDLVTASLFESRSIQQVLDEDDGTYDFGWKSVMHGWEVDFSDGRASYGSLVSLNQNRKGVGVQGPTSIAGTNGSPNALVQKLNITNTFTQVNGWKSSSTPASYALDYRDVQALDSTYVYADAYVSWNGETGEVLAPGADGAELVEYPATNTVEVDI